MNDILRFWKTCVNYEERTGTEKQSKPGKRRLHNYKLRQSTADLYSGIIYLKPFFCGMEEPSRPAVMEMVSSSPTERSNTLPIRPASRPLCRRFWMAMPSS